MSIKVNSNHMTIKPMHTLEDLRHQLNEMAKHRDLSIIYPIDGDAWDINLETSLLTDGSSVTDVAIDVIYKSDLQARKTGKELEAFDDFWNARPIITLK
jgi:hypothetical protein